MKNVGGEHSSFVGLAQVSEVAKLWQSFRKALDDVGTDAVEVGLFLSHANKEMLRYQEYLLRLGLDVNDIRNPQVVGVPVDKRPHTQAEARRIEGLIQFGITMLMQWWMINGVGTHAVWSDLGDESLSDFVSTYCRQDISLSRKKSGLDALSMACSLWLLEGQDLGQASRPETAKKAVEIMRYAWELYWLQLSFRQAQQGPTRSQKAAVETVAAWAAANISLEGEAGTRLRRSLGAGSPWDRWVRFVDELPTAATLAWANKEPREPLRSTGERRMNLARRIAKSLEDAGDEQNIKPERVVRARAFDEPGSYEKGAEDPAIEEFERSETLRQQTNVLEEWVEKAQFSEQERQVYELDMQTNYDTVAIAGRLGKSPEQVRVVRKRYTDKLREAAGA